jgi:hypothetical protein
MLAMAEARAGAMMGRESDFVRKRAFWRFSQSRKRVSESARGSVGIGARQTFK